MRNGLICGLMVAVAIWISHPVAEMGFIDDFSYIKTSQVFAQTGRITYNGWATAMLGWLIPWGSLFIKLFGFSFTSVRLADLPIAVATVVAFHAFLRRYGISPGDAIVGALTLGLSPLFLPLASSFMTDVPGVFVIVMTLYLCQRAIDAQGTEAAIHWLVCAAVANVIGGSVRQISWLGALIMIPSVGWLLRRTPGMRAAASWMWLVSVLSVFISMRWFALQPFALQERLLQGPLSLRQVGHMSTELLKALLCFVLVLLPILISWIVKGSYTTRAKVRTASVVFFLAAVSVMLARKGTLEHRVMPWLGHVIGTLSIFPSTGEMLGSRPATIPMAGRIALSLIVIGVLMLFAEHMSATTWKLVFGENTKMRQVVWLLGPFSFGYVVLLLPRAAYSFIYDRYLLGLMPGAILVLLLVHQRWISSRLSSMSIVVLGLYTLYTVAGTHDWFALNRARVAAVNEIHHSGVPMTSIQGGFDFDGWTQIEAAGYINDARIRNPAGKYRPPVPSRMVPACRLPFSEFTPAIEPKFFVVFEPMNCLEGTEFPPTVYRTWLPPFHRAIYIQTLR